MAKHLHDKLNNPEMIYKNNILPWFLLEWDALHNAILYNRYHQTIYEINSINNVNQLQQKLFYTN